MDDFKKTLVSSTGWKIVATIMSFVYILNLFTTWFGTEKLPATNNGKDNVMRLIWFIPSVIFWIPGIIISLKFVWIDN